MSLDEKIGQIFVFTWLNEAQAHNDLRFFPGGYIRIYSDALTVARQTAAIHGESRIPLAVCADLERGIGGTIAGACEVVSNMAIAATGDERNAFEAGRMIGEEALAMGINMNYSPVLDINSNPKNPVINIRSFGADADLVARFGVALMKGMQAAGVATSGKHFPGHGDTSVDSHDDLAILAAPADEVRNFVLKPFKAAIDAGIDSIMSAHLLTPTLSAGNLPATLNREIMTGLLRDELGFKGVAVTDALDMGAISKNFPAEMAVPMAINAGCDQLIMPSDNELVVDILKSAVARGEVPEDRLNEAVLRLLTMKHQRGILIRSGPNLAGIETRLSTRDNHRQANAIADQSITAVRGADNLPLTADNKIFVLEAGTAQKERGYFLEPRSFSDHLKRGGWQLSKRKLQAPGYGDPTMSDEAYHNQLAKEAAGCDVIVLAIYASIRLASGTVGLPPETLAALQRVVSGSSLEGQSKPVVVASFGNPYAISDFPYAQVVLCAFSETQASQEAMARALRGEIQCTGISPVPLD